ncbi:MAG: histidine kinase [Paenibacillus macerans]|nr:histidine kinase [Paenibacillus macerans]
MSIRRKLFLFIPLLVLLMSSVSFFLFESGKNVQESYHLMMKRILLYKEVSYEVGEIMRAMNRFIMQVDTESLPEVERHLNAVRTLRADLDGLETIGGSALPLVNYRNIVDTFLEQAEDMIDQIGGEDSGTMAGKYIEAEQTQRFIREEAQELVDLELELKTLQSQINPHFLFNTLNSISKLAYIEGAPKTSDLAVSVSRLLRYNLQKLDQAVPLREEVQHVSE